MTAIRSTQFAIEATLGSSGATLYTVPAGGRVILKEILIHNAYAGENNLVIAVYDGATQLVYWRDYVAAVNSDGETKRISCWTVLEAGQHIEAAAGHDSVGVLLSGALL